MKAGSAETKGGILRRQAGTSERRPVIRRSYRSCSSILRILLFHIADDRLGLPALHANECTERAAGDGRNG